jgi:hypothetical protein
MSARLPEASAAIAVSAWRMVRRELALFKLARYTSAGF